jgi:cysteine desulfurase/selenocysteine lyase
MIGEEVRSHFPILRRTVNGFPLVYMDSAATSLKPVEVIETLVRFYTAHDSNVWRSPHVLGAESTDAFERAREKVARFIGARPRDLVLVTSTTDGINRLAEMLARVKKSVMCTVMDHHSNMLPWRTRFRRFHLCRITREGEIDVEDFEEKVKKADVVAFPMVSNVSGTINDVRDLAERAKDRKKIVVVDGAQGVPHMPVNVSRLEVDALAFSGHKMLGPHGSGGLYISSELRDELKPVFSGGDSIKSVRLRGEDIEIEWMEPPHRFEAGTPSIANYVALGTAVDFLSRYIDDCLGHERRVLRRLMEFLEDAKIKYLGPPLERRCGLVSIAVPEPDRVAYTLAKYGVCTRAGHHCANPLHDFFGVPATLRFSLYIYNTEREMDYAVTVLDQVLSQTKERAVRYVPPEFPSFIKQEVPCTSCPYRDLCSWDTVVAFCPYVPGFVRRRLSGRATRHEVAEAVEERKAKG